MRPDGPKPADMSVSTYPRRLVAYGNSISAQKSGFFTRICEGLLHEGDISSENASVGGVGSLGLAALIDLTLRPGNSGVAIVETSASDAAGATAAEDLPGVFSSLIDALRGRGLTPLVVHLPRFDIREEQLDLVRDIQDAVCRNQAVPSLNLRSALSLADTHDRVHLTDAGAQRAADLLLGEVRGALASARIEEVPAPGVPTVGLVPCGDPEWSQARGEPGSFRLLIPTRRYPAGVPARVEIPARASLGLVMVVGPSSGAIHVAGGAGEARIQLWDRWCTFRRLQVVHLPRSLRGEDSLVVSLDHDGHADVDAWGAPSPERRIGDTFEIVGLITRSPERENT